MQVRPAGLDSFNTKLDCGYTRTRVQQLDPAGELTTLRTSEFLKNTK